MTTIEHRTFALARTLRMKGHDVPETILHAEWLTVDRAKQRTEGPMQAAAVRLFSDQRRAVIRQIPEVLAPFVGKQLEFMALLFDVEAWKRVTERLFRPLIAAAARGGWDMGFDRVGVTAADFSSELPTVASSLFDTLMKTKGINDTTANALGDLIQRSLTEGASLDEITARVSAQFGQWQGARARLIAETASVSAFEAGQQAAFEEAGVERKRWLTQRDGSVRPSHSAADSQEQLVAQPFEVGGFLLNHPGDSTLGAPPGETIRCRCTSLPIL